MSITWYSILTKLFKLNTRILRLDGWSHVFPVYNETVTRTANSTLGLLRSSLLRSITPYATTIGHLALSGGGDGDGGVIMYHSIRRAINLI